MQSTVKALYSKQNWHDDARDTHPDRVGSHDDLQQTSDEGAESGGT
jgi:hypothetical protein